MRRERGSALWPEPVKMSTRDGIAGFFLRSRRPMYAPSIDFPLPLALLHLVCLERKVSHTGNERKTLPEEEESPLFQRNPA